MNKMRALHPNGGFKEVQDRLAEALQGLKFGTVEIQIHDSRVVRITRTEKVRLDYPTDGDPERD
ncbi:MAG TPA: YezD family protein [Polyangiaceae bacterium]|nr:YezD family protein [Polyangiaceae bacterium]